MLFLSTDTLKSLRERPRMYFGLPPSFPALCNYVWGCQHTLLVCAPGTPAQLELDGFDQWLCERFQISLPSFRWWQVIWERESDDLLRVQMFVDLFLEYRAERERLHLQPPHAPST